MEQELDLRDIFSVLRKRFWLILCMALLGPAVAGLISYYVLTPVYEASTKIIVNQSEQTPGIQPMNLNDITFNIRLIDTYKEIIKTPAIMDLVVEDHPEFGLTSNQLIGKVQVKTVNNSQVMTLRVQDPDYEKAAQVVNAISEVFQREIPTIMHVDNVSILSRARTTLPPPPVEPKPVLNIAIAFVLSLMLAVGLAFLIEYLDDTVRTTEDVDKLLQLPTLATIGRIKKEDLKPLRAPRIVEKGEKSHDVSF